MEAADDEEELALAAKLVRLVVLMVVLLVRLQLLSDLHVSINS